MKKAALLAFLAVLPLSFAAAQQSITDVISDAVANYLSPLAGKGTEGEKLIILHFKSPTRALNDWAVDRFTEGFKARTGAIERRNRPVYLNELNGKISIDISDAEAASYGARLGAETVITGAFAPSGRNWALSIRAVNAASRKTVWSKNYTIAPGETFTSLASSPEPNARTPESRKSGGSGAMALIPAGQFVMGSPVSENGRSSSELEHRVTIAPFYLSATEVTQLEYEQLTGRAPSANRGSGVAERERLPVESVSWFEAVDYCNMLSAREGLLPAYSISGSNVTLNRGAPGYRLPTEAEWEYACRAGTETAYYTGPSIAGGQANYHTGAGAKTRPVGSYAPNPYGLYDMAGNAAEWVWDWYAEYGAERLSNPTGPGRGYRRVVRGGSCLSGALQVRSASRGQEDPSFRSSTIGFRIARSAE